MTAAALFSILMLAQSNGPTKHAAAPDASPPAAQATAPVPEQAPATRELTPAERRKIQNEQTLRRRRASAAARRARAGAQRQAQMEASREHERTMAPIIAQQQAQQAIIQIEAARARADQASAAANQERANIARQRLLLDAYRGGFPIIYGPNGPYIGGYSPYLVVPPPQIVPSPAPMPAPLP